MLGDIFNINSHNQTGGITAGIVNQYGKPQRVLNDESRLKLLSMLNPNIKTIKLFCPINDSEGFKYASEMKIFLISKEFTVDGVNQAAYMEPFQGVRINPDTNEINIGSN